MLNWMLDAYYVIEVDQVKEDDHRLQLWFLDVKRLFQEALVF